MVATAIRRVRAKGEEALRSSSLVETTQTVLSSASGLHSSGGGIFQSTTIWPAAPAISAMSPSPETYSPQTPVARTAGYKRPLRVAIFLYRFPVPSETFVDKQIAGLVQRGLTVDVVCRAKEPGAAEVTQALGIRNLRCAPPLPGRIIPRLLGGIRLLFDMARQRPSLLIRLVRGFKGMSRAEALRCLHGGMPLLGNRYDVIHCHFGPAGLHAAKLRQLGATEARITTVFHGWDVSQAIDKRGESFYDPLFRIGDLLLPVSEHWRQRLIELGANPQRTRVHHMGVAMPPTRPQKTPSTGTVRLLSVCRLVEKKGLAFAIRALASRRSETVGWKYHIIGDGPELERLQQLAFELGCDNRVVFAGWGSPETVEAALQEADIFLAPSITAQNGDQEGIPVGVMEAMAHGLPVVSTYHTGIPELVSHGQTGLLAEEGNVEQLAQHLQTLLQDPELRQKMGTAGYERVASEYEIEGLNDELVNWFHELADAPQKAENPGHFAFCPKSHEA